MIRASMAGVLFLILVAATACASSASGDRRTGDPAAPASVYVVDATGSRRAFPYVNPADGRPLSLAKLIAIRGGIAAGEDASRLRVTRQRAEGRTTTAVDFTDIVEGRRPDFLLRPDDVITIARKGR